MANVKLIFSGDAKSECYERTLQVFTNTQGKLYIEIEDTEDDFKSVQFTVLDKDTAIKFSKELRKQIALMFEPVPF